MHHFKKNCIGFALILMAALSLGGCGTKKAVKVKEAVSLIESREYEDALKLLNEAEEEKENPRLIARSKGIAYLGQAQYEEAIQCFLDALAGSNGLLQDVDYDLNYYLASAYTGAGKYQEAKEVYDSILALKPNEKEAYYLRGGAELSMDQFNEAKADYDKAVAMDPKNYDRLFAIYEEFAHFGYKAAGQEYLQKALDNGAKTLSSFDKGRIYYFMEDYQSAYVELENAKAEDKEENRAESSLYLGKAYEATGDYNYACNVYRSYLDKHGDSAEMYNQLGICEMKRGNYEAALSAFTSGLDLEDNEMYQVLSFNEIVANEYLGRFSQAEALMQKYLRLYPTDEEALREQIFLATRVVVEEN
ncbi:MAG: tetratricopeptide repeat protein [Lachnospiraceae bacterium]|nr:tetratricopeptide repeat protein [Lachnospiraceae bacterium]